MRSRQSEGEAAAVSRSGGLVLWGAGAYFGLFLLANVLPSGANAPLGWDAAVTPDLQNALHVPTSAGLVVAAGLAVGRSERTRWLAVLAGCAGYASVLECSQALVPGRTASVMDLVMNLVGVAAGGLAVAAVRRLRGAGSLEAAENGDGVR